MTDQQTPTILIVDDEPDNFEVVEILLFKDGYHLHYVSSGREAIAQIETIDPDLILLDVMMPEMDGIETCEHLKAHPTGQHIPVLMLTALSQKEDLARCLAAGADDFLSKPVNGLELRARVKSMLRIKQQYDYLQDLLQIREDLTSAIVHDLRNPLTTVVMSSEILKMTPLNERQMKHAQRIVESAQRLRTMIDNILLLARLQSNQVSLECQSLDLGSLVDQVVTEFETIAALRKIHLAYQAVRDLPRSWLDESLIRRVIENLLSNAIKFSPENSTITLAVTHPTADYLRLCVCDQGPGISDDLKPRVFDRYEIGQSHKNISQTGLGLTFCKLVVDAHGGAIFVQDHDPHGACLIVDFPLPTEPSLTPAAIASP